MTCYLIRTTPQAFVGLRGELSHFHSLLSFTHMVQTHTHTHTYTFIYTHTHTFTHIYTNIFKLYVKHRELFFGNVA